MSVPLNLRFDEYQFRADYDGQTDGNPRWMAFAAPGVGTADSAWILHVFTYDASRQATQRSIYFKTKWDEHTNFTS